MDFIFGIRFIALLECIGFLHDTQFLLCYFGCWLLASGFWQLVTGSKILEINRGLGNLGADNRKIATAGQEKETSSQPATSSVESQIETLIDFFERLNSERRIGDQRNFNFYSNYLLSEC